MAASFNMMQDEAVRAALALDEAVGELGSTAASCPAWSRSAPWPSSPPTRRSSRPTAGARTCTTACASCRPGSGATDLEGVDLASTLAEIASTVGRVLDVDVVAIYTADEHGQRSGTTPIVWHPGPAGRRPTTPPGADRPAPAGSSRGWPSAGAPWPSPTSPPCPSRPTAPTSRRSSTPSGYAAWILSPVHDADGNLLALLGLGHGRPGARVERGRHRPGRLRRRRPRPGHRPGQPLRAPARAGPPAPGPRPGQERVPVDLLPRAAHPADLASAPTPSSSGTRAARSTATRTGCSRSSSRTASACRS